MTLAFDRLTIEIPGTARPVLDDVSLSVAPGEVVGLVGESGSGKSTTARAALGLVPDGANVNGSVRVDGSDVFGLDRAELRRLRAEQLAMIYQNPRATLNPVRTVGAYATEQLIKSHGIDSIEAQRQILELLTAVGLRDPERQFNQHPHELSGGMLQRVVIAAALAAGPRILLADEATSALDVSTQASIVGLLLRLRRDEGLGIVFITHDLALATAVCDRVCVMYAGRIVEVQAGDRLLAAPLHPYSAGLRDSTPELLSGHALRPIDGSPPSLGESVDGCPFAPRCPHAEQQCRDERQTPTHVVEGQVACRRHEELALSDRLGTVPGGRP